VLAISCEEMKAMDSYAINNIGIPSILLMENAALRVLENINLEEKKSFTILCGTGNNGGDGLALARHLILRKKEVDLFIIGQLDKGTEDFNINLNILKEVDLFIIGQLDKGTEDFNINLNILKKLDVGFIYITGRDELNLLEESVKNRDLTIDSIFGIGLTRRVEGLFYHAIDIINRHSKEILSVDIPSGLDGDTGEVWGISVKADKTVTFHLIKKGLLENGEYTGKLIVEDIGIPDKATRAILKRV